MRRETWEYENDREEDKNNNISLSISLYHNTTVYNRVMPPPPPPPPPPPQDTARSVFPRPSPLHSSSSSALSSPLFNKVNCGGWINSLSTFHVNSEEFSSVHWVGSGPVQKKSFQKNLWFSRVFFYQFCLILVCILYHKDTNLLLKYPIFVETLQKIIKKCLVFMHTTKSLKNKK